MIDEKNLEILRERVQKNISEKRFRHIAEVEKTVTRLAKLFCPEKVPELRAAALLHDVTKECTVEEQKALFEKYGLQFTATDALSPKTLHARSAAAMIPSEFPEFATETVISAVRWHTTGHSGMTLTEKLLYLADYIDDSRTYDACVALRNAFWGAGPEKMSLSEREDLLRDVLIASYNFTVRDLLEEARPIARETVEARNELLGELAGIK